jgi:hypothetical protein
MLIYLGRSVLFLSAMDLPGAENSTASAIDLWRRLHGYLQCNRIAHVSYVEVEAEFRAFQAGGGVEPMGVFGSWDSC